MRKRYYGRVLDYLDRDGGTELLLAIDSENGTLHTEFESKMSVSRATVSNRISEAKDLDLIEITWLSDDHGNAKRYVLSQIGRVFRVALESMELDETYQTYLEAEQELEDGKSDMRHWVLENTEYWGKKDLEMEFELEESFKQPEKYPGDNIPDGFVDFLVGDKPLYLRAKEAIEHHRDDERGDNTNSGERDSSS